MRKTILPGFLLTGSLLACLLAGPAQAATVWTNWTSSTAGANGTGSALGTLGGITVSYAGEVDAAVVNGTSPIWAPNTTFIGGTVSTSPSSVGDEISLNGSFTGSNTITFSAPVVNPVFAIWSLGAPGAPARFTFTATPTLEAGGPNSQFGGSSIVVSGNVVTGSEGNGVIQFTGTFTSISWTDTFENFYAITVGVNGDVGPAPGPAPEPASFGLMGLGLAAVAYGIRKGRQAA